MVFKLLRFVKGIILVGYGYFIYDCINGSHRYLIDLWNYTAGVVAFVGLIELLLLFKKER